MVLIDLVPQVQDNRIMNTTILALLVSLFVHTTAARAQSIYQNVYDSVNQDHLVQVLKEMTGVVPVTVQGEQYSITNRYTAEAKAKYRKYWTAYFQQLGMQVQEFSYQTAHTKIEKQGHNLEAILPGMSDDSIVIIVHYDSMGPNGHEAGNPGVDDDMTGMSVSLETARILAPYAGKLKYTVRFVAADFEEWASPGLEGARVYAKSLQALAKQKGFKIVAAIDNEQIGWSGGDHGKTVDIFSCSNGKYNFQAIGDAFEKTAKDFSGMKTKRSCMGANSDHYAMWEIGVPAVVYSEHNPFSNPHFDAEGDDTFEAIDQDYFFNIARIGVTFAATLAGIPNAENPAVNFSPVFEY
jgi:Zn-dependent M28 family amino/carboxypeptidase